MAEGLTVGKLAAAGVGSIFVLSGIIQGAREFDHYEELNGRGDAPIYNKIGDFFKEHPGMIRDVVDPETPEYPEREDFALKNVAASELAVVVGAGVILTSLSRRKRPH